MNTVWDAAERHPRIAVAALFLAVAVAWSVRSSLGAMALTGVAAFVLGRGVGLVRAVSVKDKLTEAERELVLAREHGVQAAADLEAVRRDLAGLSVSSTRTQRMPAVGDGDR
ncbi:hypothetical protein [Actinacidiphila oryziradicis]|uniref:hypothetical protein n=1 Tax=Actinacidiphila oryziradicis TaxID=2571141 RepID=UPI0023F163BC|nr:hypothetical protein [Actinacidiphila oryziradicis]